MEPFESMPVGRSNPVRLSSGSRDIGSLLVLRSLRQLVFQSVKLLSQLVELVKFCSDHFHLVPMHCPKHLDHHGHGLLKLIKHLLLHHAELIYQAALVLIQSVRIVVKLTGSMESEGTRSTLG